MITCDRLVRVVTTDGVEVQALQGLDLLVAEGELPALVGASGSGKSTLMNILAGLDVPTAGAARVAGRDLLTMDARTRLDHRRNVVGFVRRQTSRNLLPYLAALQDVTLPMHLRGGRRRASRTEAAEELLPLLSLTHCRDRRPHQLSGGEAQRTAIAAALANSPPTTPRPWACGTSSCCNGRPTTSASGPTPRRRPPTTTRRARQDRMHNRRRRAGGPPPRPDAPSNGRDRQARQPGRPRRPTGPHRDRTVRRAQPQPSPGRQQRRRRRLGTHRAGRTGRAGHTGPRTARDGRPRGRARAP
ncbi:ATP-binding cassette domain-containing protein, partial [Streptomyces noursei]|uniref:ABC transporter ATP-binding protein n=1 Tax=Streptomyces noursei TaxID=1971 RepID=UPI003AF32DDE